MKLHLPVLLFRAVMALLLAAPSALYAAYTAPTTITIPSGYTQVTVDALADITAYSSTAQDVAFRLDASSLPKGMLTISDLSSSLMTSSADSWYFTSYSPSSLASLTFCEATTRLFYVESGESLQFTALQHLLFEGNGNTCSTSSAIYGEYDNTITLSNNGSVEFVGNKTSSFGGAIFGVNGNTITLSNNGSVTFSDNMASGYGGAIYGYDSSTITLSDNGSVEFSGNTASSSGNYASGGAIDGNTITLRGNGIVTFSGNTASCISVACGGAIYDGDGYDSSTITLRGNGSVTFSGNTASTTGSSSSAYGGAIYGESSSTITLSDNESVSFSENTASGKYAEGGAIRAYGHLSIQNNDSVLFEKNVEKSDSSYRLRSIYAGGSGGVISLSAAEGKSIEFRDSVYIASGATFHLNADYTDDEGVVHKQAGDIVFTGVTTESDLYIVKGNVAGTAEEIRDSRTTEVKTVANLHNGRLIIKEGAIWSGDGITVVSPQNSASKPTLLLQNGSLSGYAASASTTQQCVVTICSGAAFEAAGKSKIEQTRLVLESGSILTFNIAAHNKDTAVLTLGTGSSLERRGALTLQLKGDNSMEKGVWYNVLTDGAENALDISHTSITIESGSDGWKVDKDDLRWVGSTLQVYFDGFIQPTIEFNPNLDRNQQEVYDTVKDIMADGNPGGVLGLLGQEVAGSRDEAALKRVLDELSGREYATIMSSQMEGNMGHLRRLRAAAGAGTPLGEYVSVSYCYPSNKGVDKSDNKGATVMMAPSPVLDSRRIRAGVSAFHEQAELDADSNANGEGFERSETGAQLTMEYLVSNDFVFGMGLSHSRTKLTPTFGKRRDEDNTHFDLFGVYRSGRWSSTTALGVGLHQHELGRTVAGMQTQAEADGLSVNFMQDVAYSVYADEEQGLQVFGSVESSFNQVDAFSETGAGNASLCVEEQDAWVTDVTLGLRYNHTLPALGKAPAGMFSVQGGVVASLGDTEPEATLRFAGAPGYSYKQYAAERSRWGYSVGASVNMPVSASTAVFGTAEAVLRNNAYTVDAQVGVKMAF